MRDGNVCVGSALVMKEPERQNGSHAIGKREAQKSRRESGVE